MVQTRKGWRLNMNLILYFIGSYIIGNVLTGYLFVKFFYHADIQKHGSGNPGARNAGRIYGRKAFIATFLGDALKGSLVILIGRALQFSDIELLIGLALVVFGHIKPIIFSFKGGKGISTFIGGILTFEPLLAPIIVVGFLLIFPFTKSFTLSGLASLCLIPFFVTYMTNELGNLWVLSVLLLMLIFAHSENLFKKLNKSK